MSVCDHNVIDNPIRIFVQKTKSRKPVGPIVYGTLAGIEQNARPVNVDVITARADQVALSKRKK